MPQKNQVIKGLDSQKKNLFQEFNSLTEAEAHAQLLCENSTREQVLEALGVYHNTLLNHLQIELRDDHELHHR